MEEKENNQQQEETSRPREELEEEVQFDEKGEPKAKYSIPWTGLIFIGVIIVLMVACIIVIAALGGFN